MIAVAGLFRIKDRRRRLWMDHPNIAKVLDGGATQTGRPYFVMELVRGTKITAFCDQNRLTARERSGTLRMNRWWRGHPAGHDPARDHDTA